MERIARKGWILDKLRKKGQQGKYDVERVARRERTARKI